MSDRLHFSPDIVSQDQMTPMMPRVSSKTKEPLRTNSLSTKEFSIRPNLGQTLDIPSIPWYNICNTNIETLKGGTMTTTPTSGSGQVFHPVHEFQKSVIKVHSQVPMNSPLDEKKVRTNYALTLLMADYIEESLHENGRYDALVSNSVLADFMRWIAYQDQ